MGRTYDDIYTSVATVISNMRTEDIVAIHNKYCEDNMYLPIIYDMSELDNQLCNMSPREILNNIDDEFDVRDNYFYITDCEEIHSFNWFDDEYCPIYLEELAKWVVENDEDCGNAELKDALEEC